jgi:hypothetical protein
MKALAALLATAAATVTVAAPAPAQTVDRTPPTVTIAQPADRVVLGAAEVLLADYDCADEAGGSGVATCEGDVADGQPIDTTVLGWHEFRVTSVDAAGNQRSIAHAYRVADLAYPTVEFRTPVHWPTYRRDQIVVVDYSCQDEPYGSGLASCDGEVPDGALLDTSVGGVHCFEVLATDNAFHRRGASTCWFVYEHDPPTVTITSPVDGQIVAQDATVIADYTCDDGPRGSRPVRCDAPTPDGEPIDSATLGDHVFAVHSEDYWDNTTDAQVTYTVVADDDPRLAADVTGPQITHQGVDEGDVVDHGQAVLVRWSCTDGTGSGLVTCRYPTYRYLDTETVGSHTFTLTATDGAGNTTTVDIHYQVVDRVAPTISITSPASNARIPQHQTVLADYDCADRGGSGLSSCDAEVADGDPVDTSTLGPASLTITATDGAGNTTTATRSYRIVDVTAPHVDITSPVEGQVIESGDTVIAQYTCQDEPGGSGLVSCDGYPDSGRPLDTRQTGARVISVTGHDAEGHYGHGLVHFTVVRHRPDASVRFARRPPVGRNQYGDAPEDQQLTATIHPGRTRRILLRLENDGTVQDHLVLSRAGSAPAMSVSLPRGPSEPSVYDVGAVQVVPVDIRASRLAEVGRTLRLRITLRSADESRAVDVVGVVVTVIARR